MKHRAMPIRSIKITGVLTLFLVVILYSAGFGSGAAEAATEKIVKIGSIGPFTGPAARVGQEFKNAIEMAFDQIDWKIGDYKVQFVWIDSESDAEKAVKAYEKAIVRDKIDVGFNSWHTWVSASCMEVAAK
jgi:branched-chain amino acid transport system substrate-binding protein